MKNFALIGASSTSPPSSNYQARESPGMLDWYDGIGIMDSYFNADFLRNLNGSTVTSTNCAERGEDRLLTICSPNYLHVPISGWPFATMPTPFAETLVLNPWNLDAQKLSRNRKDSYHLQLRLHPAIGKPVKR